MEEGLAIIFITIIGFTIVALVVGVIGGIVDIRTTSNIITTTEAVVIEKIPTENNVLLTVELNDGQREIVRVYYSEAKDIDIGDEINVSVNTKIKDKTGKVLSTTYEYNRTENNNDQN